MDRRASRGDGGAPAGSDLVWRCKIIELAPDWICVEPPAAFGATLWLAPGTRLVGGMTIGQNRWMFHTQTLRDDTARGAQHEQGGGSLGRPLRLAMPLTVERCSRRSQFRISTADLNLPRVQCWPLIDPTSVGAAETANRAAIMDAMSARTGGSAADSPDSILLPEVGPMFSAALLNISGGGLGLLISPADAPALASRPLVWLRVDLRPEMPLPVAVTTRVAHTHIDSTQQLYAGMAFDFAHNPGHRAFVIEVINTYVERLQRQQREGECQRAIAA